MISLILFILAAILFTFTALGEAALIDWGLAALAAGLAFSGFDPRTITRR